MPRSDEHRGPESTFGYDMERVRVLKNRRAVGTFESLPLTQNRKYEQNTKPR